MKKQGFTLAEVLVVLGILGVVVAITLPTVIQNYKKNVASARLKKFVSVVDQALISAEQEYGSRENWEQTGANTSDGSYKFLDTYIKPYVKNATIEKRQLFNLNVATLRFDDGSQMSVKVGACFDVFYDINGEALPNKQGSDIFMFILCRRKGTCNLPNNKLTAFWCQSKDIPYPTHEEMYDGCKSGKVESCTMILEQNGYNFPKDYPSKL